MASRLLATIAFALVGASCITVQAPQCPNVAPPVPAAAAAQPDDDEKDPLSTVSLIVVDGQREAEHLQARCSATSCPTLTNIFGRNFPRWLAHARRQYLVITVVGDRTGLPLKYHADYLPEPLPRIRARMQAQPAGRLDRTLQDGTRVIVLFGADEEKVLAQIDALTF